MSFTLKIENGDIVKEVTNGEYKLISGRSKSIQDVAMVLTTDIRPDTGDGCGLRDIIGKKIDRRSFLFGGGSVMLHLQTKISSGIGRLMKNQKGYQYSQRGSDELIYDIAPVQVWEVPDDPRTFRWRLDVLTVDGKSNFGLNGRFS